MKLRIVKTLGTNGRDYYSVEKKYWLGWFVVGNETFSADYLSLEKAKEIVAIESSKDEIIKVITV